MQQIQPNQVSEWAEQHAQTLNGQTPVLLDVREAWEVQTASVPPRAGLEIIHMPMRSIPARYMELDRQRPIACLCHHGARSMQVAYFLHQQGFAHVANVAGGINAWAMEPESGIPFY